MKKYLLILAACLVAVVAIQSFKPYTFNFKDSDIASIVIVSGEKHSIESADIKEVFSDIKKLSPKFYYGKIKAESSPKIIITLKNSDEYILESGRLLVKGGALNYKTDLEKINNLLKKHTSA